MVVIPDNDRKAHPPVHPISFVHAYSGRITAFAQLTEDQLNWRTSESSWSIGQCLQHLLKTNEAYFPAIEKIMATGYRATFWEKNSPFTGTVGKSMIEQLGTRVIKRFKAPRLFLPSSRPISTSVVEEAVHHLNTFDTLIKRIEEHSAMNSVLRSPVSGLITIRVQDVLTSLFGHAGRHLEQAERIRNSSQFPK